MTKLRAALGAGEVEGRSVVVDGVRLAYDDQGEGEAILCLHSIAHGARDYAPLRERLRERCRVVALDWPGHGRSADDRLPATAARYAELLDGFVTALGLDDVVVIGNSIGGSAALRLAARRPERVRALVLADSAGLDRVDAGVRAVTRAMAAFFAAGARGARWFPRAFALYYRMLLPSPAAREQRARIVAAGSEMAPRLVEAWRSFGEPDADQRAAASALACPVLVTWAKRDRVLRLRRSLPAIRRIPDARVALFDGGHAPFLECPDAFAAALRRFLDDLSVARAGAA
jgi:4,5:9,10-diseco-3-hydroxy-5,9,17-trioxoandrosta-1(10),2-diene-4-oate hydrolase